MDNDYFHFCKALYKKVSWASPRNLPKRKDLVSDDYLALVGGAISILITLTAIVSPFGLAVIGALIGLGVLVPLVVWPVLKGVAKVGLAFVGLGFDIMAALPKLGVSLYNRITGKGNSSALQALDKPREDGLAVPEVGAGAPEARAIESNQAFLGCLEKLKTQPECLNKLTEHKSEKDSTKTVSASVTLDITELADKTTTRTFTVSEVDGKTVFKLDLPQGAEISSADSIKLLEQMCRTAIKNELRGSPFQVHPSMGTEAKRKQLREILDKVRAEAPASLVAAAGDSVRSSVASANQRNLDFIEQEAARNLSVSQSSGRAITPLFTVYKLQGVPRAAAVLSEAELEHKHESARPNSPGP